MSPEYPYYSGLQLTIASHTPPQPFGLGYHATTDPRPPISPRVMKHRPKSEWVEDHPPFETTIHRNPTIKKLLIVDVVAGNAKRRIQVFRVVVEGKPMIAKFFDPLFYPYPSDVTYDADKDYSKEAAAYEDIRDANLEGKYTPKYHGAWTCRIGYSRPAKSTIFRAVRLVLIEEIEGLSMEEVIQENSTFRFTPEERLTLMARIHEIEAILEAAGIRHNDVAPRNVMLSGLTREYVLDPPPKIVLIDFNDAVSFRRVGTRDRWVREVNPINPIYKRRTACPTVWRPWVPEPFRTESKDWIKWTLKVFSNRREYSDHPSTQLKDWLKKMKDRYPGDAASPWSDVDEDDYYTNNEE